MMPGISGIKTCEEIRKISFVPILFLTAKSDESDKLLGFMAGGDDYITKPFSYAELLARIKALLRRQQKYANGSPLASSSKDFWIKASGIRLNTCRNEVYVNDTKITLTKTEYDLLHIMMKYPQKIFSIQNLYESIWNEPYFNNSANTVMVHIRKLRKKIEHDPQKPVYIKTVWGKGYQFGCSQNQ